MVWNFSLWSKIQCNWKYRGIVDSVILIFPYLSWLFLCITQRRRSFLSSIQHLKGYCKRHQKCSVSPHFPSNPNTQLHWWILTCRENYNLFQKMTKRLRIRYYNHPFFIVLPLSIPMNETVLNVNCDDETELMRWGRYPTDNAITTYNTIQLVKDLYLPNDTKNNKKTDDYT